MVLDKFDLIENKLADMLNSYQKLKIERDSMVEQLAQKETLIQTLGEEIQSLKDEKMQARDRVDNLLSKLNDLNLDELLSG